MLSKAAIGASAGADIVQSPISKDLKKALKGQDGTNNNKSSEDYDPAEALYKKFVTGIYIDRVSSSQNKNVMGKNQQKQQSSSSSGVPVRQKVTRAKLSGSQQQMDEGQEKKLVIASARNETNNASGNQKRIHFASKHDVAAGEGGVSSSTDKFNQSSQNQQQKKSSQIPTTGAASGGVAASGINASLRGGQGAPRVSTSTRLNSFQKQVKTTETKSFGGNSLASGSQTMRAAKETNTSGLQHVMPSQNQQAPASSIQISQKQSQHQHHNNNNSGSLYQQQSHQQQPPHQSAQNQQSSQDQHHPSQQYQQQQRGDLRYSQQVSAAAGPGRSSMPALDRANQPPLVQQLSSVGNELEFLHGRDQANSVIRNTNHANNNNVNVNAANNNMGSMPQGQGGAEQQQNSLIAANHGVNEGGGYGQNGAGMQSNYHTSHGHNMGVNGHMSDRHSMQYDGLSFDALFGSHYDSDKDENYSEKEDLIQNTKTYQNDFKPFKHNVSKAEIAYLKSQQKYDSLLFAGRENDFDFLQNPEYYMGHGMAQNDDQSLIDEENDSKYFEDVALAGQRRGTRSQIGGQHGGMNQAYDGPDGGVATKRRKLADDNRDEELKSEGVGIGGGTRMTRQRMMQQNQMNQRQQQQQTVAHHQHHQNQQQQQQQQQEQQLQQNNSSNTHMNILSRSSQSQHALGGVGGAKQSNGSSLPGGTLLNRHQSYGNVRGQTPTKNNHNNSGRRAVQTKSIECQVSPGLLDGAEDNDDRNQRNKNDGNDMQSDQELGTIGKRRQEKKKRRRRRSKKQIDEEAAAAAEKEQQMANVAAAQHYQQYMERGGPMTTALQQQRMQQDQMAFEIFKQQQSGYLSGQASGHQGFNPYLMAQQQQHQQQQRAAMMYPQMNAAQQFQHHQSAVYYQQNMMGMIHHPGYPHPLQQHPQHPAAAFVSQWNQAGAPGGPPNTSYQSKPVRSSPPNSSQQMVYQHQAAQQPHQGSSQLHGSASGGDHQMQAQTSQQPQDQVSQSQTNAQLQQQHQSKRKKSQQSKLQKQQQQATNTLLLPQMLFGTNMVSSARYYNGAVASGQGATDFNIMEHFGLMLGPSPLQLQAPPDVDINVDKQRYQQKKRSKDRQSRTNNAQGKNSKHQQQDQIHDGTGQNFQQEASNMMRMQQCQQQQAMQQQEPQLSPFQEETVRSKLRKEFYPFLNQQLKDLIQQIDMYIQLLYQVLLFDESSNGNKTSGGSCADKSKKANNGNNSIHPGAQFKSSLVSMLDLKNQKTPQQQNLMNQFQTTQSTLKQGAGVATEQSKTGALFSSAQTRHDVNEQQFNNNQGKGKANPNLPGDINENSSPAQQDQIPTTNQQTQPGDQEELLLKKKAYCLLYQFINKRDQILKNLELPTYEVPWLRVPQQVDNTKKRFQGAPATEQDKSQDIFNKNFVEDKSSDGENDNDNDSENHQDEISPLIGGNSSRQRRETIHRRVPFKIQPQVTYLQAPLLEYAPFVISQIKAPSNHNEHQQQAYKSHSDTLAHELNLTKNRSKPVRKYTYKECFDTMKPLINRYLLPPSMQPKQTPYPMGQIASQPTVLSIGQDKTAVGGGVPTTTTSVSNNNRRKFSRMDDNMMILGLQEFGQKNMEAIRIHWLPRKTVNEIKHRYKNLTCQRVHDNMVKQWKYKQSQPLTEREFYLLCQGVKWFGESTNRWALIAKSFLTGRTVKFISVEFSAIVTDCEKSNRFGKMLLLDVPDEKLLSLANLIPQPKPVAEVLPNNLAKKTSQQEQKIDITEQGSGSKQDEEKEQDKSTGNLPQFVVDHTMEIIRKKVQIFEEIDIDRIDEFVVTLTGSDDHLNRDQNGMHASVNATACLNNMNNNINNNDLSLQEDDSAIIRGLNMDNHQQSVTYKQAFLKNMTQKVGFKHNEIGICSQQQNSTARNLALDLENGSGGLASFLQQDNLLLSDATANQQQQQKQATGGMQGNSQLSVGDFLKKHSSLNSGFGGALIDGAIPRMHSPIKPFNSLTKHQQK